MSPQRILVVEDEMVVQLHLTRIVQELGHDLVGAARNTAEALEAARRGAPDLVLMDIHLADGDDGVDTAATLSCELDCAVVFVTAYADQKTLDRADGAGASGYLVKPFTAPSVRAAITTAMRNHERLRDARGEARALSTIANRGGEALFLVDGHDRIAFASPRAANLAGSSARELEGCALTDVLAHLSEAEGRAISQLLVEARTSAAVTERRDLALHPRHGTEHRADLLVEPVTEGPGSDGSLLVHVRDRQPVARAEAPTHSTRRPFGAGTRLLVYSHDTFGLGHLRRCLSLIRAVCAQHPEASALLVTGSPMVHRYTLPPGADYVKLPAIRKVESEQYEARTLRMSGSAIRSMRSNLILHTVRDFDPNVLLVDHSPTGSKGELLPTLEHLAEQGGCTRILGLRDVIDDPAAVTSLWRETGVYDVLRDHYDHCVVYGDREVFDPVREYEFPAEVARKASFVDYVCDHSTPPSEPDGADADDRPLVAVTIGGGDGGGETVLVPFLEMMRRYRDRIDFRAELLTGPFVAPELARELAVLAEGLPVTLRDWIPSTAGLFRRADVVVATAGYNTTCDLLLNARRAVLIPRVLYRQEQQIRARRLAALGLATCLGPDEVTPERLFEALSDARRSAPLEEARAAGRLNLDGAQRFAEFCGTLQVDVRE